MPSQYASDDFGLHVAPCSAFRSQARFDRPLDRLVPSAFAQHSVSAVRASATGLCHRAQHRLDNFAPPRSLPGCGQANKCNCELAVLPDRSGPLPFENYEEANSAIAALGMVHDLTSRWGGRVRLRRDPHELPDRRILDRRTLGPADRLTDRIVRPTASHHERPAAPSPTGAPCPPSSLRPPARSPERGSPSRRASLQKGALRARSWHAAGTESREARWL